MCSVCHTLTAELSAHAVIEADLAGVKAFLTKPELALAYNLCELLSLVDHLLFCDR